MRHYRGFEDRLGFIGPPGATRITTGGIPIVGYTSGSGWAARPIQATEFYMPPTVVAVPPSISIPPLPRLPDVTGGDIRPESGQVGPVDMDDMSAENGVPGVDDSGRFPYGDPRSAEKAPPKMGENTGLIIAAIIAALVLGG